MTSKRNFKNNIFTVVLAIIIALTSVEGMAVNAQGSNTGAVKKIYQGNGFEVEFRLSGQWESAYSASITLKNTGEVKIENWYIGFNLDNDITNLSSAQIYSHGENYYCIKSLAWNQDINVGGSITFDFTGQGEFKGFPEKYDLLSQELEVDAACYSVDYKVKSNWGAEISSSITLRNISDTIIEDWGLAFDFKNQISSIWNASVNSNDGEHYIIKGVDNNQNIAPGQSIEINFEMNHPSNSVDIVPENFLLTEIKNLMADTDGDSMPDHMEKLIGTNPNEPDTDGDGLSDHIEFVLGYGPLSKDTDNNGISDGDEDYDEDGLSNKQELFHGTKLDEEDTDKDGLTDYDEITLYFTDPLVKDTDEDGINDYDEVLLGLNPLKADSDGNNIPDGEEKIRQSYTKEIYQEGKPELKSVEVTMSTSGNLQNKLAVHNVYDVDKLSAEVEGLVGVPVEIVSDAEFEQATITFNYDKEKLSGISEDDLAIMWYDEENDWYKILDTESVIDKEKNCVSYVTNHFSTYMLVDKNLWYDAWREDLNYRTETADSKYYDFAFVVDCSGSMEGSSISNAKKSLTNFISAMSSNDKGCIIKFARTASVLAEFTSDKSILINKVNSLEADGTTSVNAGLVKALSQFEKLLPQREKAIVLICDGDVDVTEETINKCVNDGIKVFCVNVSSIGLGTELKSLAEKTGGQYYSCFFDNDMEKIFASIKDQTIGSIDTTDTDGDGLFDVYEEVGFRMPNGKIITSDLNKADTDGDSLTDYEEIGIVYNYDIFASNSNWTAIHKSANRYIGNGKYAPIKYILCRSNPREKDTDFDGVLDPDDRRAWTYDVQELLVYQSRHEEGMGPLPDDNLASVEALDLRYGDKNQDEIMEITPSMKYQFDELFSEEFGVDALVSEWKNLARYCTMFGLSDTVNGMIDHFMDGTGSDYYNDELTQAVVDHGRTKKYVEETKEKIINALYYSQGDLNTLRYNENTREDKGTLYDCIQRDVGTWAFDEVGDYFNGLMITLHGLAGNNITVKDYIFDGENFSGTLHYKAYDYFGLDDEDIKNKTFQSLAGFRAWYILQRYNGFKKAYRPFITKMEFDVPFSGSICVIR